MSGMSTAANLESEKKKIDAALSTREVKYQSIQPPTLNSLSGVDIHIFLKAYAKYKTLRERDQLEVPEMRECLDISLKEYLEYKDEDAVEGEKIMGSEKLFEKYLAQEEAIEDAEELADELSRLEMNMEIKDAKARLVDYEMRFLMVKKRAAGISKLREKALVQSYVRGLRPKAVQRVVEQRLQWQDLTLKEVMSEAADRVMNQDEYFRQSRPSPDKSEVREVFSGKKRQEDPKRRTEATTSYVTWTTPEEPKKVNNDNKRPETNTYETRGNRESKCYRCGGRYFPGHNFECPANPRNQTKKINAISIDSRQNEKCNSGNDDNVPAIMLPVEVGERKFEGELDTGAVVSCITKGLAQELTKVTSVEFAPAPHHTLNANHQTQPARLVTFNLKLPSASKLVSSVTLKWTFTELAHTENVKTLYIGRDLQKELGILREDGLHLDFLRFDAGKDEELAEEIDDGINDEVLDVNGVETVEREGQSPSDVLTAEVMKVKVPNGPFGDRIRAILMLYSEVFDPKLPKEGADFPPFHIDLVEDKITHIPPRHLKPGTRDRVRAEFRKLRDMGIIRDSHGPYMHPAVVVETPEKVRVCGDYRATNEVTKPLTFPLPNITKMLQMMQGAKVLGKMDARKGFHQLPVYDKDIPKTAVATEDDYIEYPRIPFGVRNGPMWYQQLMTEAYIDYVYKNLAIFIDDFMLYAQDEAGFLDILAKVLQRTKEKRLRLNAEKCTLGFDTIEAVGYVVTPEGRQVSKSRVEAINNIAPPTDVHTLRSFLGAVNYFREFIEHYSEIAEPLNKLLEKDSPWRWSEEENKAFEKLKAAVTSDKTLAFGTEENGHLVLRTDASGTGIGGVLLLRTEKGDRPVTYFSKTLSKVQRRWATVEQELYAIVYALSLQPYSDLLQLRSFTIETDHRNLIYLDKLSESNNKLRRWRLHLMRFPFSIHHIPGTTNGVADALSRLPIQSTVEKKLIESMEEEEGIKIHKIDIEDTFDEELHESQKAHAKELEEEAKTEGYLFDDEDQLWYKKNKAVVPSIELKRRLLCATHGSTLLGHMGVEKTMEKIEEEGYTWKEIYQDVRKYVKECGVCQKMTHRLDKDTVYLMKTTAVYFPFQVIAIDAIGPLLEDKNSYKYILTMIDCFTRWIELVPTHTLEAEECAQAIMDRIFLRHGLPKEIRSDNGTQYVNKVVQELLKKVNVRHHRVLPYHPQANGIVERANQEIMRHLRCLVVDLDSANNWSQMLAMVQYILNHTVHTSTGETPYDMLYGRVAELRNPLEPFVVEENSVVARNPDEFDPKTYVDKLTKNLAHIHYNAQRLQEKKVEERVGRANKNKEPSRFELGELVLYLTPHKTTKLAARQSGPYKITAINEEKVTYQLQNIIDPSKTILSHPERLCRFMVPEGSTENDIKKLAAIDEDEYLVSEITAHRGTTKDDLEFQIVWTGYEDMDPEECWEPYDNVRGCDKLEEYIVRHPAVAALIKHKAARKHKNSKAHH